MKPLLASSFLASAAILLSSPTLAEDKTQLEKIVVTASEEIALPKGPLIAQESGVGKSNVSIMDTPRSVSVITEQRMEDQNALSVQEALQYTSGVYASAFGNDSRGDWSYIRGTAPVQYLDGLKSLFGYYNNTRPHTDTLSRIEVLKGPASVQYGQGSVGGILNLQSKLPQAETLREMKAEIGSFNHKQLTADFAGKADEEGKWLYRLVALGRDSDTQMKFTDDDSLIFQPSLTWAPTQDTSLTLLANIQENRANTNLPFLPWAGTVYPGPAGQIDTDTFLSEPGWDRYDTSQRALTALFDHRFNDVWSVHAGARYTDSKAAYNSMWPDFPPTVLPDNTVSRTSYVSRADAQAFTSDARLSADFNTGIVQHQASFGFDYQDATTNNDYVYGSGGNINIYHPIYGNIPAAAALNDNPINTVSQTGFYAMDNLTIDHWILSLGLRHDSATSKVKGGTGQDDDATTYNAGLMYRFDNGIAPYVSYAESFNPVTGVDALGNTFKPLEGKQYEAGIKYQPPGTNHIFTAAVFDITEENRTTSDPNNPGFSVQTGEVGIQGFELEAQTQIHDFDILASYSFLDAEITKSNDGNEGAHVGYVPDHMASSWVTWRPSEFWQGFRAGAGVRYVGNTYGGQDIVKTPSYTLFDAMIGYDLSEEWSIQINAKNLADDEYVASCGDRGDCAYGQRRTVIASTTYRF